MNNILITLKKELKLIVRDRKSLLMMAITPLFIPLFVILMSYIYETITINGNDKEYYIGVNYELNDIEKELLNSDVKYNVYNDINELEDAYNSNKIIAYIVKDNSNYSIYTNTQSEDGSMVISYLITYLDGYNNYLGKSYLINNNIDIDNVYNNISYNVNEIKGESLFGNQIILMAITFTIMSITLSSIYTSTDSTAGEKERGTLETVLTFPIKRRELVLGKYLAICISGLITMVIGVFLSILSLVYVKNSFSIYDNVIFNVSGSSTGMVILVLIFYTLFISGLCITIASFTKSYKEAQSALTPISLITSIPMFLELLNIDINGSLAFIPIINHTIVINDILTSNASTSSILITIISSIAYIVLLLLFINNMYKSEKILFS